MAACHFPGIAFGEVRVWQLTLSCRQACFYAARKQAFSMDHFITGGLPTWETSSCQDWQTFSCVTNPYSNGDWRTWSISWKQFICLVCQTQEQAPRFKFDKRLCFFDMWKKNKKEKERNKKVNGIFDKEPHGDWKFWEPQGQPSVLRLRKVRSRGGTSWQIYEAEVTSNRPLILPVCGAGGGCHPDTPAGSRGWHSPDKVTMVRGLPSALNSWKSKPVSLPVIIWIQHFNS